MSKFHVNAEGNPGKCSAAISCPFGGESEHYATQDAAREAYEAKMASEAIPTASSKGPASDAEVSKAIYELISYGDDSYLYNEKAAENWAKKTGMKQEAFEAAIVQLKKEDADEQAAKEERRVAKANEIISNTDPDVSKVKKGSTVVLKNGNTLVKVKVTSHRNGKISGNGDDGNYYSGEPDSEILTSASKLENKNDAPAEPAKDPEIEAARRWMLDTGDADSFLYDENAARDLAKKTGMKEEKIQAVLDEWEAEEQAELDAKYERQKAHAREVAANTDPDISKVKKGSTVAFKFGDDDLVTVKVSSHRNGKIYGNTSDGTYADEWPDSSILTSESKLDD